MTFYCCLPVGRFWSMSAEKLPGKSPDEMTLIINGYEIVMESAKLVRTMDTCADAFTCTIPWEPGVDPDLDKATAPFGYQDASVYVGGDLELDGTLYDVTSTRDSNGTLRQLSIYSKTADLIDSTVFPPYEANNISLTARCRQQAGVLGIQTEVAKGVDLIVTKRVRQSYKITREIPWIELSAPLKFKPKNIKVDQIITKYKTVREEFTFSRVTANKTDTIFSHLSALASQRGLLLSCTKYGDLLIVQPNLADPPVGTIEEPAGITNVFSATFSGRSRFGFYRALANSAQGSRTSAESRARDGVVTRPRFLTFQSNDNLPGEAVNAALWRKNKSAADALNLSFPVNSWYAPNGKLWTPNTTVTVVSPTIGINEGFTFLISQVEFDYQADGAVASLQLKPPTAYTTGEISEPWIEG
jgi:prophage tail gpP-like protein